MDAIWTQWEKIKQAEKQGTKHERTSALDGIPRHLPALLRAEKLVKKARKAGLPGAAEKTKPRGSRAAVARELFALARYAQARGWSAEELLLAETGKHALARVAEARSERHSNTARTVSRSHNQKLPLPFRRREGGVRGMRMIAWFEIGNTFPLRSPSEKKPRQTF